MTSVFHGLAFRKPLPAAPTGPGLSMLILVLNSFDQGHAGKPTKYVLFIAVISGPLWTQVWEEDGSALRTRQESNWAEYLMNWPSLATLLKPAALSKDVQGKCNASSSQMQSGQSVIIMFVFKNRWSAFWALDLLGTELFESCFFLDFFVWNS